LGEKLQEFDRGLLGRWLHMLLVAFYTDEEAVVADLLYKRSAMVRDTAIAKALGLPEKQVRQALERRLVPDGVIERQTVGIAPFTQTYYRICSTAVGVAALRLQTLEDSLGSVTEEEYFCPKCRRAYDSMQAVSLTRHQKNGGSNAFAFLCEECDEELIVAAETAKAQHERLQRFRRQCRDLLVLTREIKDMPIPKFGKETTKSLPPPATAAGPAGGAPPPSAAAAKTQPERRAETSACHAWFHKEIFGTDPLRGSMRQSAARDEEDGETVLREALEQAQDHLQQERLERFSRGLAECAEDVRRRAAGDGDAGPGEEPTVMVQGKPHPLSRVRDDEDMLDSMTDQEYQRFVELERQQELAQRRSLLLKLPG